MNNELPPEPQIICPECGSIIPPGQIKCLKCGYELLPSGEVEEPPAPPTKSEAEEQQKLDANAIPLPSFDNLGISSEKQEPPVPSFEDKEEAFQPVGDEFNVPLPTIDTHVKEETEGEKEIPSPVPPPPTLPHQPPPVEVLEETSQEDSGEDEFEITVPTPSMGSLEKEKETKPKKKVKLEKDSLLKSLKELGVEEETAETDETLSEKLDSLLEQKEKEPPRTEVMEPPTPPTPPTKQTDYSVPPVPLEETKGEIPEVPVQGMPPTPVTDEQEQEQEPITEPIMETTYLQEQQEQGQEQELIQPELEKPIPSIETRKKLTFKRILVQSFYWSVVFFFITLSAIEITNPEVELPTLFSLPPQGTIITKPQAFIFPSITFIAMGWHTRYLNQQRKFSFKDYKYYVLPVFTLLFNVIIAYLLWILLQPRVVLASFLVFYWYLPIIAFLSSGWIFYLIGLTVSHNWYLDDQEGSSTTTT